VPKPKKGVTKDGLKFLGYERALLKYEIRVTLQHGGERYDKQCTVLVDSLREAEQKRDAFLEKVRSNLAVKDQPAVEPIDVLLPRWLATLRHSTRVTYTTYARRFGDAFGARSLASLSTQELQAFLAALPLADSTVNFMRAAYCVFFKWAKAEGEITQTVLNALLSTERRKTSLSDAELLDTIQDIPASRAMDHDELVVFMRTLEQVAPEEYLIFGTQYLLGCRIGEAIAIHWSSIDEATGRVIVRHNFSKGKLSVPKGKKARLSGLGPSWLKKLQEHRARSLAERGPMGRCSTECESCRRKANDLVFPAPASHLEKRRLEHLFWYYGELYDRFIEVQRACGITLARRTATHALRYTFVSLVRSESQQVVASRMLGVSADPDARDHDLRSRVGHSTQSLTESYTHVPSGKLIDLSHQVERRMLEGSDGPERRKQQTAKRKARSTDEKT
jgi:integrase